MIKITLIAEFRSNTNVLLLSKSMHKSRFPLGPQVKQNNLELTRR